MSVAVQAEPVPPSFAADLVAGVSMAGLLLPEAVAVDIAVPEWPQFMRGCVRYRQSLDEQAPNAERQAIEFKEVAEPGRPNPAV